jgi:hypothetical protein
MATEATDDEGHETGTDGPSSLVDRLGAAAEAAIYAPLGFALEARNLVPRLTERGRNHVAMARMMGEFAVRRGSEDLAAGALAGQERLLDVLRSTGLQDLLGGGSPPPHGDAQGTGTGPASTSSRASETPPGPAAAPVARVTAEAAAAAADIDPDSLGIPGYDLLSASQVVPRLEGLTTTELELVQRYEAGTRGRKTILAKIAQLRAGNSPGPPEHG